MIKTDVRAALTNYFQIKSAILIDLENIEVIKARKYKTGSSIIKINPKITDNDTKILNNLELEDRYQLELTNHKYWIYIADLFIEFCAIEIREIVIDIFINKTNMDIVELNHSYSKSQINKLINKEIELFCDKMNVR